MSLMFALLLAANPTAATSKPPVRKPKLKCERIHEVGTLRPRRVCVARPEPKGEAAAKAQPTEQAVDQKNGGQPLGTGN